MSKSGPGVLGWLTSCTVSSCEEPPLGPLTGVLTPGSRFAASSPSVSEGACDEGSDGSGCGEGVALCTFIKGGSRSLLPDDSGIAGLFRAGGGDFSRGDTGHLGVSLDLSAATEGFCGCGARCPGSFPDGGGKVGVLVADICCRGADVGGR